jgi:hypothetical protein
MNIHQIQMAYDQRHDRILMRLSTRERTEFRFWLTRRFVKRFGDLLWKMLERDESFRSLSADARRALLGMQHEAIVDEGDFSQAYAEQPRQLPLGSEPVLLATAKGGIRAGGGQTLSLRPVTGQGIDMRLDSKLLHLLVKILRDAVSRSDWDISIVPLAGGAHSAPASPTSPRTLN